MERSDKCLNRLAPDVVACFVSPRLDVDLIEPKGILIDQPVDSFIVASTDAFATLGRSAVAHLQEQVHDGLFEELRMTVPEPIKKVLTDSGFNPSHSIFDDLNEIGNLVGSRWRFAR